MQGSSKPPPSKARHILGLEVLVVWNTPACHWVRTRHSVSLGWEGDNLQLSH